MVFYYRNIKNFYLDLAGMLVVVPFSDNSILLVVFAVPNRKSLVGVLELLKFRSFGPFGKQ